MSISKWHPGKLIILWAWGAIFAALALTSFLSSSVVDSPVVHLITLFTALIILIVLSGITWRWLSGRETRL